MPEWRGLTFLGAIGLLVVILYFVEMREHHV